MELVWDGAECCARYAGQQLVLQSGGLERIIDFSAGAPRTGSISLNGKIIAGRNRGFDVSAAGLEVMAEPDCADAVPVVTRVEAVEASASDNGAVLIEVETWEARREIKRLYRYVLYPGLPMTGIEWEITSAVVPLSLVTPRLRHEDKNAGKPEFFPVMDTVTPVSPATDIRSVEFRMRTDFSNDLLREHRPAADGTLPGSILHGRVQDTVLVMFQEAPPPNERRDTTDFDFLIRDGGICQCGCGFTESDVEPGRCLVSHRSWFGALDAAAGDAASLVRRFYCRRIPQGRQCRHAITVNPWGSGSFYQRVNEDFLLAEIAASARCGADVYQVDDGYQQGGVLADITRFNRPVGRDFWQVDPVKLPRGLRPLVDAARSHGLDLSLWFAAGSNREFRDHEESAEVLLNWYREYGIRIFKLDGVRFTSYRAERNFVALLRKLYRESDGRITVNLDVTNGIRGGVGYLTEFGTIFLENRYVCHDFTPVNYHPVQTLRNLWTLSRFVPTRLLQIEVASPAEIDYSVYVTKGFPVPDAYDFRFWLGVTLFAEPLLWFQPSRQPAELLDTAAGIMAIHRQYREAIFAGDVHPIGTMPGQGGLSGFAADSGFVIVYRTLDDAPTARLAPPHRQSTLIYASGPAEMLPDGTVTLENPGTFALWQTIG
ncbi:MAG: alpha-galactosidase [Lentisphaeria bacterium]|nr:alpha-galactosidase [Lentisphaeria bacterium]